jgi:hypothetical protein
VGAMPAEALADASAACTPRGARPTHCPAPLESSEHAA